MITEIEDFGCELIGGDDDCHVNNNNSREERSGVMRKAAALDGPLSLSTAAAAKAMKTP